MVCDNATRGVFMGDKELLIKNMYNCIDVRIILLVLYFRTILY